MILLLLLVVPEQYLFVFFSIIFSVLFLLVFFSWSFFPILKQIR